MNKLIMNKIGRNIALTLVCALLGIMVAWQYKSIDNNNKTLSYENKRATDLRDELIAEKKIKEDLEEKYRGIESELKTYEDEIGKVDEASKTLIKNLNDARIFAGLVDVKGDGIIVTVDNNDFVSVEDTDILYLINELRASDAQAISINDERIVATSEIRLAGNYIMINGKQMGAPFVVKAISDPEKLEHSLKIVGGIVDRLKGYQLKVRVEKSDNVIIPKVREEVIRIDKLSPAKE